MSKKVRLDRETLEAISDAVRMAQLDAAEVYAERYVTGEELCSQISMFSKNWLESFGWKLPRERIEVTDDSGQRRVTRWGYPIRRIQRMIHEGRLRSI